MQPTSNLAFGSISSSSWSSSSGVSCSIGSSGSSCSSGLSCSFLRYPRTALAALKLYLHHFPQKAFPSLSSELLCLILTDPLTKRYTNYVQYACLLHIHLQIFLFICLSSVKLVGGKSGIFPRPWISMTMFLS